MALPPPSPEQLEAIMASMHAFNVEAFTLLGVALTITGLRMYVRISSVGIKGLWADDYLVVIAAVSLIRVLLGLHETLTIQGSVLGRDSIGIQRGQLCPRPGQQFHVRLLKSQSALKPS